MTDLTALAARIEREPPSRELDAEIARALGWKQREDFPNRWQSPDRQFAPLPEFTSSPATLVQALIARVRALEAALRPFARFADRFGDTARDDSWVLTRNPSGKGDLTMGDVRAARAALKDPS